MAINLNVMFMGRHSILIFLMTFSTRSVTQISRVRLDPGKLHMLTEDDSATLRAFVAQIPPICLGIAHN